MKKIFTLISMILSASFTAQQVYCDFEGVKVVSFAEWNGTMDTLALNPDPTSTVNSSMKCGKYIRDTAKYDNFKLFPYEKLTNVSPYAANSATTPKMTMKLFTKAPVGTEIYLQLGIRDYVTYPEGVHSEYKANTTAQNAWQTLIFNYTQTTPGTTITPTSINKIVLFFRPGFNTKDTIYFDDPTGPILAPIGIEERQNVGPTHLFQNIPNPAKENTEIKFQLDSPGKVSLKLYDMLGKEIMTIMENYLNEGTHKTHLSTSGIANGVYFYILKKGNNSKTMKMIVVR